MMHSLSVSVEDEIAQDTESSFKCSQSVSVEDEIAQDTESSFKCSQCSFCCNSSLDLKSHTSTKHGKKSAFDCSECDYRATTKYFLGKHIAADHPSTSQVSSKVVKIKILNSKQARRQKKNVKQITKYSKKDGTKKMNDDELSLGECNELIADAEIYDDPKDNDWGEV